MGEWGCMRNRRVDSLPAKWASQISLYIVLHFSVHFLRYRKPVGIKKQDEWKFDETWECQRVFYLFFFIWHFLTDTVASVSRFNIIFVNWTESQCCMRKSPNTQISLFTLSLAPWWFNNCIQLLVFSLSYFRY